MNRVDAEEQAKVLARRCANFDPTPMPREPWDVATTLDQLVSEALALPEASRAYLAEKIIASLPPLSETR